MAAVRLSGVLKRFSNSSINLFRCPDFRNYTVDLSNVKKTTGSPTPTTGSTAGITGTTKEITAKKHLTTKLVDNVYVVTFDSPGASVNSLSREVMMEVETVLNDVVSNNEIRSVVLMSGKPNVFIAGADISMLAAVKTKEEVEEISRAAQRVFQRIEDSKKPFVAAIKGSCLGGGLELALACHYRIAMSDKKTLLGLPEVSLGLLPGGGGTQRLPKLVSVIDAIEMCTKMKNITADKAKRIGLIDEVVYSVGSGLKSGPERNIEYLEEVAIFFAKQLQSGNLKINREAKKGITQKIMEYLFSYKAFKNYVFNKANQEVLKATKGFYPGPPKILEVIRKGLDGPPEEGYRAEARAFAELAMTPESKGLMSLFFGRTQCNKNRYGKPEKPVQSVAVLGSGLMGAGIAQVTIDKRIKCVMKDINDKALHRGTAQIQRSFANSVARKKINTLERDQYLSYLLPTTDYNKLKDADIVIEAVFEDVAIKHKVIKEIEAVVPPHCVIASNTSAIPISELAPASKDPSKVLGMHYFSPVDKMQLLEVIITGKNSKEACSKAVDLGLRQGKVVIVVGDSPGFYTTRIISAMFVECMKLLQEGFDPRSVDGYTLSFGFPVGSVTLMDEVGLDVGLHIADNLKTAFGDRFFSGDTKMLKDIVNAGFLGRKSGKGIFIYEGGQKNKPFNDDALKIIAEYKANLPDPSVEGLGTLRLVSRFVNEAVLCLQENVLQNPVDGDIGAVFGLGFPPFTGGPFRWLDYYGCDKLVAEMEQLQKFYGNSFKPCQLLLDHAKDLSKKFYPK